MEDYSYRELKYWVSSYYDVQKLRVETGNRIASLQRAALTSKLKELGVKVKKELTIEDKKQGKKEESLESLKGKLDKVIGEKMTQEIIDSTVGPRTLELFKHLQESEKTTEKAIQDEIKGVSIWEEYLKKVKGIGPVLAGGLVSCIDISYAEKKQSGITYASSLWAYAGLTPDSKRKKGERSDWNPWLKALCWKIGGSFLKVKNKGTKFYYDYKEKDSKKHPELQNYNEKTKQGGAKHLHNRALRYLVKKFLVELWWVWRKQAGLPTPEPYAMMKGHSSYEKPGHWFVD